ncbi:MAG: NAD(P)/FAD-dependent oxidoreductase [Holophagaceae bacterium]|nr:NAD(P)/FAD-dependent oxidoreductase [Holophagaceae bacterium]
MDRVECVVAGAGVVGLAVARALAKAGHEVLILEAGDRIGTGISSRNSEVVHAGIYYPQDSLKASLCVSGNRLLYDYCASRGVAHQRCGKLIVATEADQIAALRGVQVQASANGVELEWLDSAAALEMEPKLRCAAALHSPATGIVDSHGLMRALLLDAEQQGAQLVLRSPVLRGCSLREGVLFEVGGPEPSSLLADRCFNCAGLGAQALAMSIDGIRPEAIPPLHLSKGTYFSLPGAAPFSRLVYPVPVDDWLGVHLTLDLAGQARFGPDAEWVEAIDYGVDPARAEAFYAAVRRYWPGLPEASLQPAYAGIRPKLQGPGEPARDFLIQGEADHGVPGLTNFFGIDSPGLTACLAIAQYAMERN